MRQDADRRDSAAECQRARVAHEDLGRMRVEAQEGQAGHHHGHAEDGKVVVARHIADERIGARGNGHRARSQAVEAVRQVDRVARADEHEEHEEVVADADVDIDIRNRDPDGRVDAKHARADDHRHDGDEDLAEHLLLRFEAEVALLDDLDVVIEEAQHEVAERDEEGQQHSRRQRRRRDRRDHDGQDDHDAAHRRRAALGLMALRPFLTDALSEFELVQLRDQ